MPVKIPEEFTTGIETAIRRLEADPTLTHLLGVGIMRRTAKHNHC